LQFRGWDYPEVSLLTANQTGNYDIHVYIFGGASPLIRYQASQDNPMKLMVKDTLLGIANVEKGKNYCIVDGDRNEQQRDLDGNLTNTFMLKSGYRSTLSVVTTVAHEIGHIIIGSGHPDEGDMQSGNESGAAPLPGTDRTKRLMYSQQASEPPSRQQLVKKEWDAADDWLTIRPRGDN
jgi:hypothetical protein